MRPISKANSKLTEYWGTIEQLSSGCDFANQSLLLADLVRMEEISTGMATWLNRSVTAACHSQVAFARLKSFRYIYGSR